MNDYFTFQRASGRGNALWAANLGVEIAGVGFDIWGIIDGFDEMFRSYPHYSETEPVSDRVYGVVEGVSSFAGEFDSQAYRLRNSLVLD